MLYQISQEILKASKYNRKTEKLRKAVELMGLQLARIC